MNCLTSGVQSTILIESVLICTQLTFIFSNSFLRVIINNAPYFAMILSTFLGCLNLLSNFALVIPYTILITIFKAYAKSSASSSVRYGVKAPLKYVPANSKL